MTKEYVSHTDLVKTAIDLSYFDYARTEEDKGYATTLAYFDTLSDHDKAQVISDTVQHHYPDICNAVDEILHCLADELSCYAKERIDDAVMEQPAFTAGEATDLACCMASEELLTKFNKAKAELD